MKPGRRSGRPGRGGAGGRGDSGRKQPPAENGTDGRQGVSRVRPLYGRGLRDHLGDGIPATANTGLVYDRYADIWSGPPEWKPDEGAKPAFLKEIRQHLEDRRDADGSLLKDLHARRSKLWEVIGAEPVEVSLAAPLVSGLGMGHPLEAGFVWDRNLGVPYLPGTGLKGATRAWADQWQEADERERRRLFGDTSGPGVGSVIFFAAFPKRIPDLRLDVMNPHFAAYYEDPENTAPGDWLSPRPLFFLTVAAGTTFIAAVGPRARPDADPEDSGQDMQNVTDLLREALTNIGIGAKTAVGYGYFE